MAEIPQKDLAETRRIVREAVSKAETELQALRRRVTHLEGFLEFLKTPPPPVFPPPVVPLPAYLYRYPWDRPRRRAFAKEKDLTAQSGV